MTKTLLGLRAENYKRLELVSVDFPPGGGVVAIMGQNEAGKTSLLDALETTIAGRKMPKAAKPVRDGEESARIVATFDDIVVTRVFKANGTTQIKVTGTDGRPAQRADELLSALYSHVALDPLAFSRLSDREQVDTLLPMIGFDPAPLDARHDDLYASRTVKNREVKSLEARLAAMPAPTPGIPAERVSVADLMTELDAALEHNRGGENLRTVAESFPEIVQGQEAKVEALRARLAEEESRLATFNAQRASADGALAAFVPVETALLRERIAAADDTNRAIADAEKRAEVVADLKAAQAEAKQLTADLESVEQEKSTALADAADRMPVPGLSIDGDHLTLRGLPFADASTGVKIRTGTAVAMALNPDLRLIVIRDASLLDEGNRAVIDELAKANGFLVLMEIADTNSPVGVVIEDGLVAEVRS